MGGMTSSTVLVCEALTWLPHRSIAVQVQTTNVGLVPLVLLVNVTVRLVPSQLSMAVTRAGSGKSLKHWTVRGSGTPTNIGGIVSSTVLVCATVIVLPLRSVALQVHTTKVGHVPLVVLVSVTTKLVPSQLSTAVTSGGRGT